MTTDNKKISQGKRPLVEEFPLAGSYYAIQKFCMKKGVAPYAYDEFEDRLPRPKKKNEPRGARIIVRKGAALNKTRVEEPKSPEGLQDSPGQGKDHETSELREEFSRVKELESQLLKLMKTISLVKVKKSGKNTDRDLLEQIYHKAGELIRHDPSHVKSPLSSELQAAYDKLRTIL